MEARGRRWKYGRRGGDGGDREAEESEYGVGSDEYWDDGIETGDAQVGELSCVDAQRKYTGEWPGAGEGTPPPPRRKSGGGRIRAERVKKSGVDYVTINNGT